MPIKWGCFIHSIWNTLDSIQTSRWKTKILNWSLVSLLCFSSFISILLFSSFECIVSCSFVFALSLPKRSKQRLYALLFIRIIIIRSVRFAVVLCVFFFIAFGFCGRQNILVRMFLSFSLSRVCVCLMGMWNKVHNEASN